MLNENYFFGIELYNGQAQKQANDTLGSCFVHVSAKVFFEWRHCLGLQQSNDGSKTRIDMQLTPRATRLFTLALKKKSLNLNPFSTLVYFFLHHLLHVLFVYMFMCFVSMCFATWCFD